MSHMPDEHPTHCTVLSLQSIILWGGRALTPAQASLLVVLSGLNSHVQGKHLTCCAIALAPLQFLLIIIFYLQKLSEAVH